MSLVACLLKSSQAQMDTFKPMVTQITLVKLSESQNNRKIHDCECLSFLLLQ